MSAGKGCRSDVSDVGLLSKLLHCSQSLELVRGIDTKQDGTRLVNGWTERVIPRGGKKAGKKGVVVGW